LPRRPAIGLRWASGRLGASRRVVWVEDAISLWWRRGLTAYRHCYTATPRCICTTANRPSARSRQAAA
jgi:hypothetical protein